jgi:hypothetical protein
MLFMIPPVAVERRQNAWAHGGPKFTITMKSFCGSAIANGYVSDRPRNGKARIWTRMGV